MIIFVTGLTGFVGKVLAKELVIRSGYTVRGVTRGRISQFPVNVKLSQVNDIADNIDWRLNLHKVTTVVHLAARVHIMNDLAIDPLAMFRKINVYGTLNLARQAAECGVQRFIFLSSVKVNGEFTSHKRFREEDTPNPQDPYAISKYEAEQGLLEISQKTGMEVVIIRPPLVYGPGVKANFLKMMRWVYRGIPLPLGAINNQRSLIALENLVDLIMLCIEHPAAANQIFLAADGEDVSAPELLTKLAFFLERSARLIPVPQKVLEATLNLLGKKDLAIRLCGSLQIDIIKARNLLGWNPPISLDEGLEKTAKWFLQTRT